MPSSTGGPHVLREYSVIADGERGAVIGPRGDVAWMCFPSWESPPVFSGLHGGAGSFTVHPAGEWWVWGGHYEEGSLIWRNRWVTGTSIVECREVLARPASPGRAIMLRRLEAVRGPARVCVELDMCADFRRARGNGLPGDDRAWQARASGTQIRWFGADRASARRGRGLVLTVDLAEGQTHDLALELSARGSSEPVDPGRLWEETEADWRTRVPSCEETLAPRDARLAYAVLTGLTAGAGGMVAAATTSLPERMSEGRCYDYRYAWIRDQCYAGLAVAAHGGQPELLDAHVRFVAERILADGDRLKPAYTVTGQPVPAEEPSDEPGYPGSDVVIGNRVSGQFQLDPFGEALQLFTAAAQAGRLTADAAQAARVAADAIARLWTKPDAGIWETNERNWTHSRLACVAGLRSAAAAIGAPPDTRRWLALSESILAETTRTSLSAAGYWQRAPGDGRVDASLLLPPVRGALPAGDPRTSATLDAIRERLVDEGFVYRYQIDDRPLGQAEGAFMACGFFLALAEHQQGNRTRAVGCFQRIRSGCGTPGLFTEEYDVRQRQLRANLPQAFVHALLLESATRLSADAAVR
jgi:alpha,alpha-trehalase